MYYLYTYYNDFNFGNSISNYTYECIVQSHTQKLFENYVVLKSIIFTPREEVCRSILFYDIVCDGFRSMENVIKTRRTRRNLKFIWGSKNKE